MRKMFVLVAALGLVAGACGGSDSGGGSCASVADEAISAFQDVINEFDALSLDDAAALGGEEEPQFLTDMETRMDNLQEQADDLGCSDETMEELFLDRIDTLTAEGMFGELMLQELQSGGLFE